MSTSFEKFRRDNFGSDSDGSRDGFKRIKAPEKKRRPNSHNLLREWQDYQLDDEPDIQ